MSPHSPPPLPLLPPPLPPSPPPSPGSHGVLALPERPSGPRVVADPERPPVRIAHEPFPHGIVPDIPPRLRKFLPVPHPVLEAIGLEPYPEMPSNIPLPGSANRPDRSPFRDRNQHVQMVGHQEKQPQKPPSPFVVEPGRVQHRSRRIQKRPSAPLLRIDGHELHHRPCHRKRRRPMRQLPPHGQRVVGRALRASRSSIARIPTARLARSARPTVFPYSSHHLFSSFRAWWGELSERAAVTTPTSLPRGSHGVLALPSSHTVPIISSPRSGRWWGELSERAAVTSPASLPCGSHGVLALPSSRTVPIISSPRSGRWWGELSERAALTTPTSLPRGSHGVLALPSSRTVPIISSPRSGRGGASSPSEPRVQPPHPSPAARTECSPYRLPAQFSSSHPPRSGRGGASSPSEPRVQPPHPSPAARTECSPYRLPAQFSSSHPPRSGRGGASSPSEPLFQPPHPFRAARTECSPHHHVFPHHPACHGLDGAPRSFGSSATSVQPQIHRPSEIHWAASTWNAPWRGSPRRYSSANRSGGYSSR